MTEALRVRVLGSFEIEGLEGERFGSRKARSLLKMLALARGAAVSSDAIAEGLWSDDLPSRPADQVAVLVSRLRGLLGTERIVRSDAGYALRYDWLDLDAIEELATEAEGRLSSGDAGAARRLASAGTSLARGEALADEPDAAWAGVERRATARIVERLRLVGSEACLADGAFIDAADLAEACIDADPYNETALRLRMAALQAAGRPASALAAYAEMQQRLRDDLGTDPAPETQAAHAAILNGEPVRDIVVGRPAADRAAADAELPGRGPELRILETALDEAIAGRSAVVVVEGEAGIGKSRLLEASSVQARARGAIVLSARCDELGRALPLDVVFDALHAHLRTLDPHERATLLGAESEILGPHLGFAPAGGRAGSGAYGEPGTGRALLFSALLSVLERLSYRSPVVLHLDDVHLAPPLTAEWLHFVAHRAPPIRLLVVCARRSEEGSDLPAPRTIRLGPLSIDAARSIVGPERAAELHARSGGNPLFLVELAAAPSDALPESIRDSVIARCERAGAAAPTLRSAAVLGGRVDLDLVASVLRTPALEVLEHLEEGVRRGLLGSSGSGFVFGHELVREALASHATEARRALLHREAAGMLSSRPDADPLDIAHHARLGGAGARAAEALVRAARLAGERHDLAEAERLVTEAISLADSPDARLERARIRIALARPDEAAEDARAALGLGAGAPALEVAGWAAYYVRDFDTARRLADDGARLADEPAVRASCLMLAGRVRHADGDVAGAEACLTEAMGSATGLDVAVASAWLGALRTHQSRCDEALSLLARATAPSGSLTHPFAILHGHLNRSYSLAQLGRPAESLRALDRMDEEAHRLGATRFAGRSRNFRGWILRNLGATSEADDLNLRAFEDATSERQVEPQAWALLDLTDGRIRAGDLDGARARLDRLADLLRTDPAVADPRSGARTFWFRHQLKARHHRARLALEAGDPEQARAVALEVVEDAEPLGARRHIVAARLLEAWASAALRAPVDLAAVEALFADLDRCAGIEAWWLVAHSAARLGVEAWWEGAERRVADLAAEAGPHADALRSHARDRLDTIRRTAGPVRG